MTQENTTIVEPNTWWAIKRKDGKYLMSLNLSGCWLKYTWSGVHEALCYPKYKWEKMFDKMREEYPDEGWELVEVPGYDKRNAEYTIGKWYTY